MMLLVRPIPFLDESLESYLIRLSIENCYEELGTLIAAIVVAYPELNKVFEGALPSDVESINLCFANTSSDKRYRALIELASLIGVKNNLIQNLTTFRSPQQFSSKYQAVVHQGILIPRLFLRKKEVPVCVDCLQAEQYIRQIWHYAPYQVCHIHKKTLLHKCPKCNVLIDYKAFFHISNCGCGFDLRDNVEPQKLNVNLLKISTLIAGDTKDVPEVFRGKSVSQRFGTLLWWYLKDNNRSKSEDDYLNGFIKYFANWPNSLWDELNQKSEKSEVLAVTDFNNRNFSDVFGKLLINSFRLPSSNFDENFILCEIVSWIHTTFNTFKNNNLGFLKLNLFEAAVLLNISTQEVVRLIEFGALKTTIRLKSKEKISPYSAIFRLQDVFEQWICGFQTEHSHLNQFLSKW